MNGYLSYKWLSNINLENEEMDFEFTVRNNEYKFLCNHIQAIFLIPKLRELKMEDSSFSSYHIQNEKY